MTDIADFTESEKWILNNTLKERFNTDVPTEYGDAEIRLSPSDRVLTPCPIIFWAVENCNYIIFKTGDRRYRCQFFFRSYQQYGTGVHEYDDLTECIVSLLQTQADYTASERGDI